MVRNRISKSVVGLLLLASVAPAQQLVDLSLEQALQVGFDKSKGLHASLMKVQYADAKSGEAGTLLLPSVKFGGAYTRLSSVPSFEVNIPLPPPAPTHFVLAPAILDNYNLRVTVQQPLFTGWKVQSAVDAADYSAQAAQQDYNQDKSSLVFNITSAYWNLSKAIELQKVVDENVEQVRAHVKDAQSWESQGQITKNDVLKVQVQLSEAQLRQIDARNGVQLARIALNNVLGIPLETGVRLTSTLDHQPREFAPLQELVKQALDKRSDAGAMKYRIKAGESGVSMATSNWFPQVYLTGNYYFNRPNQRFQPIIDQFKNTWDLGVGVSFDIWNWGTTIHQTDQARAQLAQAQDGFAQLQDAITLDVTSTYLNLQRAKERITVARDGVQQAEENYRITNNKFKQGVSVNTDLLDAEVALLQAKTNYTQALTDYELAEAGLERAIGE
ncbi:MAG TPA: TolC family protein [Bacteroidota bacterium]|nr:TolC family protein [Bacteroidota bacterium]